jgi:hypothetical protein
MSVNIDALELFVIVPQYGVNLVTNPHPMVTTGFSASGAGVTRGLASALPAPYNAYSRRGADCLYFEPAANTTSAVYFNSVTLNAGSNYTFSVDVLTTAGEPMGLAIFRPSDSTYVASSTFTATGDWQRVSLTFSAPTSEAYYLFVRRLSSSDNAYYVFTDGWQLESGTRATTFIIGDEPGFGEGDYYWSGDPYASTSVRSSQTRHGGYLLKISDYAIINSLPGLGMGTFNQIMTDMVSGGALYQDFIRSSRQFSVVLEFKGTDTRDLHDKRRTLINVLRPDYAGGGQPLVLRYQGFSNDGTEATQPLDIECVMTSGLDEIPTLPTYHKDVIVFNLPDGHIRGAFKQGSALELFQTLSQANNILKRSSAGAWSELGIDGLNGEVRAIAEAPNGYIIVGGSFTNAGGDGDADYLAKYNPWTNTFSAITGVTPSATVRTLAFDAAGALYVGGDFTNLGSTDGDYIVKITNPTGIVVSVSSLGTGLAGGVCYTLAIDNNGHVWTGGSFTSAGGVANTLRVARWNGTAWSALSTGLNGIVRTIAFNAWGVPWIGGDFTNATGTYGNYLCYWWNQFYRVGTVELTARVRALEYVKGVGMYVGGDQATLMGGVTNCNYIALWNNTAWKPLSNGTNGIVFGMANDPNQGLYVGGAFTAAGGITLLDKMAIWKAGAWGVIDADLPTGGGNFIIPMVTRGGTLYLGGLYTGVATTGKPATNTENSVGSANTYPRVKITGPGAVRSLINYSTGKRINFNNLTLLAGETITINLDPTDLRMESSWSGRKGLMATIASGSDHGDFFMSPGSNTIQLYMPTGTTGSTKAWIEWTPLYWSIEGAVNY